jgi:hypothetical protein
VGERGTNASRQGSARWTAHQQTRVFWAVGVTGPPTGVSKDAQGTVLGTTNFSEPGGDARGMPLHGHGVALYG